MQEGLLLGVPEPWSWGSHKWVGDTIYLWVFQEKEKG